MNSKIQSLRKPYEIPTQLQPFNRCCGNGLECAATWACKVANLATLNPPINVHPLTFAYVFPLTPRTAPNSAYGAPNSHVRGDPLTPRTDPFGLQYRTLTGP